MVAIGLSTIVIDGEDYTVKSLICHRNIGSFYSGISWHILEYGVFPAKEELTELSKWPGMEKYTSWCPITKVDYVYNQPEVTSPDNFIVFFCPVHTSLNIEKVRFNRQICSRNMKALAYGMYDYMKNYGKFSDKIGDIPEESEFGKRTSYCPITKVDYVYNRPEVNSPDDFIVLSCPVHTSMYNIKIEKGLINKLSIEE